MKIYKIKVNGKTYKVELESIEEVASVAAPVENKKAPEAPKAVNTASNGEGQAVLSPIQGTVVGVKVKVGDKVKKGDVVAVIEAMKLENDVVSTFDGEIVEVLISKGQTVSSKQVLVKVK